MKTPQTTQMAASTQFCPNVECKARGQVGQGNIVIHSRKRPRYRCKTCGKTFSGKQGTMFAGLRKPTEVIVTVVTLLAYGCPVQAIVQAFGLDERTVASWRDRAGKQCEQVHQVLVEQGQLDLVHVQADEIRVKGRKMIVWMGLALMVSTRLWLGGVVSPTRDSKLADRLMRASCEDVGKRCERCSSVPMAGRPIQPASGGRFARKSNTAPGQDVPAYRSGPSCTLARSSSRRSRNASVPLPVRWLMECWNRLNSC